MYVGERRFSGGGGGGDAWDPRGLEGMGCGLFFSLDQLLRLVRPRRWAVAVRVGLGSAEVTLGLCCEEGGFLWSCR